MRLAADVHSQLYDFDALSRLTAWTRTAIGSGDARYHYAHDSAGNVLGLVDDAGHLVEGYVYHPYGDPTILVPCPGGLDPCGAASPDVTFDGTDKTSTGSYGGVVRPYSPTGNVWSFTGRQYDPEAGVYNYRARHYHPGLGQFMSMDPIGTWGDPANLGNAYAYVGNNPGTWRDPTGTCGEASNLYVGGCLWGMGTDLGNAIYDTGSCLAADALGCVAGAAQAVSDQAVASWDCQWDMACQRHQMMETIQGHGATLQACADQQGWDSADCFAKLGAGVVTEVALGMAAPELRLGRLANGFTDFAKSSRAFMADARAEMRLGPLERIDYAKYHGLGAGETATSILMDARVGKGNFGLGGGTYDDALRAGEAWVSQGGSAYTRSSTGRGTIMVSDDGVHQFRLMYKQKQGMYQANFERRPIDEARYLHNGHLDIYYGPGGP